MDKIYGLLRGKKKKSKESISLFPNLNNISLFIKEKDNYLISNVNTWLGFNLLLFERWLFLKNQTLKVDVNFIKIYEGN